MQLLASPRGRRGARPPFGRPALRTVSLHERAGCWRGGRVRSTSLPDGLPHRAAPLGAPLFGGALRREGTLRRRIFRRCFIACRHPASGFRSCSRRLAFDRSAFSRLHPGSSTLHDPAPPTCFAAPRSSTGGLSVPCFAGCRCSTRCRRARRFTAMTPVLHGRRQLLHRAVASMRASHDARRSGRSRLRRRLVQRSGAFPATQQAGEPAVCARPRRTFPPVACRLRAGEPAGRRRRRGRIVSAVPEVNRGAHGLPSCSPEIQSRQGTVPRAMSRQALVTV